MLSHLKLGANPSPPKPQDLHFKAYLGPGADQLIEEAMAPGALNWQKVPTPSGDLPKPNRNALGNIEYGDCIYVGMANLAMRVSQLVGAPRIITTDEVLAAYADTGFDPVTGENDNGAYPTEALTAWTRKDIFGTRCRAFCRVDPNNIEEVLLAAFLGGGLYACYDLPISAQNQVDADGNPNWRIDPTRSAKDNEPRGWGGHCIDQHAVRLRQGTTWGMNHHATEEWCKRYTSSLHLVLLRDWRLANGRAPNGFEFEQLLSDARARGAVT